MRRRQILTHSFLAIGIVIFLNILSTRFFYRIDLTKEKRFTLSKPSKALAKKLEDYLFVKVYLGGKYIAPIEKLKRAIREYLDEFRAYSGSMIQYDFVDPAENKELQEKLSASGMQSTYVDQSSDQIQQKMFYPGAVFTYRNKEESVVFIKGKGSSFDEVMFNAEQELEYNFASVIKKLTVPDKKKIGILAGHGELNRQQMNDFTEGLGELYDLVDVDLSGGKTVPPTLAALLVARPTKKFSEREKYEIDQYLMGGGKIAWFIDKVNAEIKNEGSLVFPHELNLDDLFLSYGIRINDNLVEDYNSFGRINVVVGMLGQIPMQQAIPFKYYPLITNFGPHLLTKNISAVLTKFSSSIDTLKSRSKIRFNPLLLSSGYNRTSRAPVFLMLQNLMQELQGGLNPEDYSNVSKIVGLLAEGEFSSAFLNRQAPVDSSAPAPPRSPFIEKSKYTKMIVIGDGSMISGETFRPGEFAPLPYDNKVFAVNVMDWLSDEEGLMEVRSKDIKVRKLDEAKLKKSKTTWKVINLALPCLLIIIFGIIRTQIRKKRNT